jgi:hypothetical protein
MELARYGEQSYKLELQAYQTAFPNFKYEPPNFVSMEIGISSRTLITPTLIATPTLGL